MSGSLTHQTADIIRQLLIDEGLGTTPSDGSAWPIYVSQEVNTPDSTITILGTTDIQQGRLQITGEIQRSHGFQITIRADTFPNAQAKANAIGVALETSVRNTSLTISASNYKVFSVSILNGPRPIGKATPTSKNDLFTINAVAAIRQFA